MPTNRKNDMMVYCSFCGKSQEEVKKIIAGNNAFICNECVELAQEIIREELAEEHFDDWPNRFREDFPCSNTC